MMMEDHHGRPHRHPLAVRSYSQPSWNPDCVTGSLVPHRSRLRCSWSGCVRSCTVWKKYRSLSLSRLQHVVAADLYFSDRLLGPLISAHAHTSTQYYDCRYTYSVDSRGILSCGGGSSP